MKSVKMNFAWELPPRDHHFSSRGECDLDVKYRCIIARAREEYQVGRFPLLLFQDNPFERQAAVVCDERYDYINLLLFTSYFFPSLFLSVFFFSYLTVIPKNHKQRDGKKFHRINVLTEII